MKPTPFRVALFIAMLILFLYAIARADPAPQPTPIPSSYVHDFAGVLTPDQVANLQLKAKQLKDEYKTEIALVIITTTGGEDSFDYSMRMARSWGIGSKDNEIRGMLVLVATQDRKTAFRTSRHIEGEFPDGVTGSINRTMGKHFKTGDFGGGLLAGIDAILAREKEVYETPAATAVKHKESDGPAILITLVILLGIGGVVALIIIARRRNRTPIEDKPWIPSAPTIPPPPPRRTSFNQAQGRIMRKGSTERASRSAAGVISIEPPRRREEESSYSPPVVSDYSSRSSTSEPSSSSGDSGGSSYSGGSDFGGGGSDSSW